MVYKAIGVMSGSSLDGLDIAYVHLQETAGKWTYEIIHAECYAYDSEWTEKLKSAVLLNAMQYQLLHTAYGRYIGQKINQFIATHQLHHRCDLISSHGHTTFHVPHEKMTAQLGDGAAIAAETCLPVISDLRALDIAFGGQGAPIVPIGEKLLLGSYHYFLNLGGIANISCNNPDNYVAFDVCAANRILNMLVEPLGEMFDKNGAIASRGLVDTALLNELNQQDYYQQPYPKSLANDFGTGVIYPLIQNYKISIPNAVRTYVEHIAIQIKLAIQKINNNDSKSGMADNTELQLLATGGGAFNSFMVERIQEELKGLSIKVVVPDNKLVNFKEALVMALIGVLRWREEYNVLSSVTGATRNSVNGAIWMGAEA